MHHDHTDENKSARALALILLLLLLLFLNLSSGLKQAPLKDRCSRRTLPRLPGQLVELVFLIIKVQPDRLIVAIRRDPHRK